MTKPNLRTISLWQPWASAMASGIKRNETRSWFLGHRGDLVICSAKRKPTPEEVGGDYDEALKLPYGFALCVVEVSECVPSDLFHGPNALPLASEERELGDYTPGRWIWLTQNCRKLKQPVPIKGHQGLWLLDDATNSDVLHMLP